MYSESLQSRIAEKNLEENIRTNMEQNQKTKKTNKTKTMGLAQTFCFLVLQRVLFGFFWSHTNFFHGKMVFQPKTKNGKRWFFNPKPNKTHGK